MTLSLSQKDFILACIKFSPLSTLSFFFPMPMLTLFALLAHTQVNLFNSLGFLFLTSLNHGDFYI